MVGVATPEVQLVAFGLSITLFIFWGVVGYAVLAALHSQRNLLQNMLLAPVVGLATTLLFVFWLNRAGLPAMQFAALLTAGLFLASVVLIWRIHPIIPIRRYLPFAGVLLLALFLTGRPMLEFNFNWLSYSNDDMANYVLAAMRIIQHGFFDIPNEAQLVNGSDYSQTYWFFNLGVRSGSEMMNAWTASLTGLTPDKIFMPLILALHLTLISAAGALVYRARRFRLAALLTCLLLSLSALTSLGTLYQLISQVGGLALLVGCAAVLLRPFGGMRARAAARHGALVAILTSALFVMYPEVAPFLILSFGLYTLIGVIRRRLEIRPLLIALGIASVSIVALLNSYTVTAIYFLIGQVSSGIAAADVQILLFPYYLIPSGLADLWGLQSIVALSPEPWLSISIVLGGLLLLAAAVAAIWQSWGSQPAAVITVVMLGLSVRLFAQRSDFGLFKLAMFVQPFILGTLVTAWLGLVKRPQWRVFPLLLLALSGLFAQADYVERSRGEMSGVGGGLVEIPGASIWHINDEFHQLVTATNPMAVVADTPNVVLAKFQALYLRGTDTTFPAQDVFYNIAGADPGLQLLNPNIPIAAQVLRDARRQRFLNAHFDLHDKDDPTAINAFVVDRMQPPETNSGNVFLIANGSRQSIINRWQFKSSTESDFDAKPWEQVRNHLVFITSQLGQPYYTADRLHVALYQLEPDLYYPGKTMAGIGRYFLFEAVNPTSSARLELNMTATLKGDGDNRLPPAEAIGVDRQVFPIVGRGSARVFSPPLTPQIIEGRPYLGIDMGVGGKGFPDRRTGLMNLYGTDISLDRRRLVGFARDISLVSEEEYARLSPPSKLENFLSDLANPDLEFSGIYEDGWVSEAAFFQLTQPDTPAHLAIRGVVPLIADPSFSSEMRMLVDGQEVAHQVLVPGDFEIRVPVPSGVGRRRIDLRFSNLQRLPSPDNRPATALVRFVGFEADSASNGHPDIVSDIFKPSDGLELGAGWYPLETFGGATFRWVNNDAEIRVPASGAKGQLSLEVEPGPGLGSQPFDLQVLDETGHTIAQTSVKGRETVQVTLPIPLSQKPAVFRLHVEGGGLPTPNDPRILNFRVFRVGWSEP